MTTLEKFNLRWQLPDVSDGESPIFALAAGWRSGSTLLQRLICSSGEVLLWGEPYGRAGIIPSMTRSSMALREDWPTGGHFGNDETYKALSQNWIANLYPPVEALKHSFAAQLDALLAEPARQRGFERFGLKEVRFHALDARFLNWIYPQARFVFMVRNPWDAWASAKGATWYLQWPDRKIDDAAAYARHWRWLVDSFLEWQSPNAMFIRYEDLTSPGIDLSPLVEHLGLEKVDSSVFDNRQRGMSRPPQSLDSGEIATIAQITGELCEALEYLGPTAKGALAS